MRRSSSHPEHIPVTELQLLQCKLQVCDSQVGIVQEKLGLQAVHAVPLVQVLHLVRHDRHIDDPPRYLPAEQLVQ